MIYKVSIRTTLHNLGRLIFRHYNLNHVMDISRATLLKKSLFFDNLVLGYKS